MKKILYTLIAAVCLLTSCESFLDQQPLDVPTDPKDIFSKETTAQKYLQGVYNYVPNYANQSAGSDAAGEPWVAIADEADISAKHAALKINDGSWNPGNIPNDKWDFYWKGIREATYFMQNIHICEEMDADRRDRYYHEARFLRAYYYFLLMRLYGPVPILPHEVPTDPYDPYFKEYRSRDKWEYCVEWVCEELDRAAEGLLQAATDPDFGRPTPGVALAVKSQLLLLSASELFNPRTESHFKGWVSSQDGKELVPTTYNAEKWQDAAKAAKAVIDLNVDGKGAYALVEKYDGATLNPYKSLYGVWVDKWNSETIFGRIINQQAFYQRLISRSVGNNCWAITAPSQKLVDAYAMKNGRYPIIGYTDASATTDGGEFPVIDPASGYFEVSASDPFNASVVGYVNNYVHPFDGRKRSIVRMWADREPRFYMDIAYNALDYCLGVTGDGYVPTNIATGKVKTLAHQKNGSGGLPSSSHTATGYCQRKMTSRQIDPTLNTAAGWIQPFVYPMIRLGEIYLNYVEALIEYDPQHPDVLLYWNKIRRRAGVPNIETVYPGIEADQDKLREMIRRERQVELSLEGIRYFDTRRWKIAEKTNNGTLYGMNIQSALGAPMGKPINDKGEATFYKRTVSEYGKRVFKPSYYLWPVNQAEMNRNRILEQAPGWR